LWNLQGQIIAIFKHTSKTSFDRIDDLVFSPNGKIIATASSNRTAKLWNLQGKEIATLNHDAWIHKIVFSPDGKTVATASSNGIAKLWNLQGGLIATLKHNRQVVDVVFSPDSKTVATASFDGTAKLWNLQGKEIATFQHSDSIYNLAFSPDGKTIATGTVFPDRTIRLWTEVKDGSWQQFAEYQGWNFVFRPDNKLIAIAVDSNSLQIRRVQSLDSSLARGCNHLKEYLASRPDLRKEICPENK
jgi:WD40 repeat protein